ncbi:MAG TPA: hypothetical protein VHJ00_20575 [Bradyrhizobium sp.]|nr:hypothetical protein [Bradyrhizobium sp.]
MRLIATTVRVTRLDGISAAPRFPKFVSDVSAVGKVGRVAAHPFNQNTFNHIT